MSKKQPEVPRSQIVQLLILAIELLLKHWPF